MFLKRYVISTFCEVDGVDLVSAHVGRGLKASIREKRGHDIQLRVGPSNNCHTEKLARFLVTIDYSITFPTAVFPGHKICQLINNNHRLRSGVAR